VSIGLDGPPASTVDTGIPFFDHMLSQLGTHAGFDLEVRAQGDLEVDAHHTVEDTGIALGQALASALGDKSGLTRYGNFLLPMDETLCRVALDLSGRPFLRYELPDTITPHLHEAIGGHFPFVPGAVPMVADHTEQLLARTWYPALSVTGVDGIPPVAQAGNGANHLKTAISNEVQNFLNARGISGGSPINLVVRADFNPNLRTAWFSAMTQVINQITLLTVILTGAALIRERDPDIIENHNLFGFDLPFLYHRAQELRIPLRMGRPEGPALLDQYEEPGAFRRRKRTRYSLAGRELIDTLDAVWRHDFSARDMPGHGLKAAAIMLFEHAGRQRRGGMGMEIGRHIGEPNPVVTIGFAAPERSR
jgi:hypothetical protein